MVGVNVHFCKNTKNEWSNIVFLVSRKEGATQDGFPGAVLAAKQTFVEAVNAGQTEVWSST